MIHQNVHHYWAMPAHGIGETRADRLRHAVWRFFHPEDQRQGYGRISPLDTYGTWAAGWYPAALPPLQMPEAPVRAAPMRTSRTRIVYYAEKAPASVMPAQEQTEKEKSQ